MQNNEFGRLEILGRNKFVNFFNKYFLKNNYTNDMLKFSDNPYEIFDAEITKDDKHFIVEIKCRSDFYVKYDDVFAEKIKLDKLLSEHPDANILYFVCYNNNSEVRLITPTKEMLSNMKIEKRLCNKTTAVHSEKVLKDCYIFREYAKGKIDIK